MALNFLVVVVDTAFYVYKAEPLEKEQMKISVVLVVFLALGAKTSRLLWQNCIHRVQGKIVSKRFFLEDFALGSQNWHITVEKSQHSEEMILFLQYITTE